jgi:cytidyltransferase-like protein
LIIVYTSVVCDLLHIGHINLFRKAKELGDKLIVGVITDDGVNQYKGTPIIPVEQRIEVISSLKYVDLVIEQKTRSGLENMKELGNISILIRGDDAEIPDEIDYIKSIGGKFVKIPYTSGISTSDIINKIILKN